MKTESKAAPRRDAAAGREPAITPNPPITGGGPQPSESFFTRASALWVLLAITLPLFFWQLGGWAFFDPDEGRYSEIPREMLASGDWVTPRLNGVLYFEKPPLLYWSVAGFFKLFGLNEWAGRTVPALAALGGVFLVYGLGRRMFGARAGWLGAAICATSVIWCVMARQLVIDTLFSAAFFAVLAFWWLGHSDENETRSRNYFLLSWLALAAAVLAKGPVSALLAGSIIFAYVVLCGRLKAAFTLRAWLGLPLFLAVTAPWFVLVAERNPGFNHFFWYGQHIGRYLGIGVNREHVQPFSYFFKLWPALFFPWSLFVPGALIAYWRICWPFPLQNNRTPRQRAALFCVLACVGVTLFFSASTSKLVTYVLPGLPPLALLMGAYFDTLLAQGSAAWRRPLRSGIVLLMMVLTALTIGVFAAGPKQLARHEGLGAAWAYFLGVCLLAWLAALLISSKRRHLPGLLGAVGGGFTLFYCAVISLVIVAAPNHTSKVLLNYIKPGLAANGEIVQYDGYTQSIGFYTGRTTRIVGNFGEIGFGVEQLSPSERKRRFPLGLASLRVMMAANRPVYCVVVDHDKAAKLVTQLEPGTQEIIWNKRRSIVGNRAAAALTPPLPGGVLGLH